MQPDDLADAIARLAHRCWCARMLREGWRPGNLLDPAAMTHDLLRPYGDLPPLRRAALRRAVVYDELEAGLAASVQTTMDQAELTAQDIYIGMRVVHSDNPAGPAGRITGWRHSATEPLLLEAVTVEWPDGDAAEYPANGGEIRPADEP